MRDSGVSAILVGSIFSFVHYHEGMKELGWLYAREKKYPCSRQPFVTAQTD